VCSVVAEDCSRVKVTAESDPISLPSEPTQPTVDRIAVGKVC